MAKRDGRVLLASLSLPLALFGCGRSLLEPDPSDTGLDGSVAVAGKAGASGNRTSSGGTQAMSGTTASVAGASSAAGTAPGGVSVTGGLSSAAGGKNTGGVTKTGGATNGLTGSAGKGGSANTGTNRTGGATVVGGSIRTGGSGGRSTMGGSIIVVTTTGGTSSGRAGNTATGGTSGGAGTTATGGRGGLGGTSSLGQTMTGGTGGSTGGRGGSTAAAMFQPLIEAFCKTARHCCTRAPFRATDLTDCESEFLNRLGSYPLVEKGTVLVNDSALAACASAYKSATAGCTLNAVKTACKDVFVGQQTEGQACGGTTQFGSLECKPVNGSATCYRPEGDTDPKSVGTCVTVPRGKNGDACSMTCQKGKTCIVDMLGGTAPFPATCFEEDGLFCSLGSNPAVCKPLLKIGDACKWEGNSCGSGNYCTWGQGSTCASAGKLGESCADRVCVEDLTCGDSLKCTELPLASDSFCMGIPSTP